VIENDEDVKGYGEELAKVASYPIFLLMFFVQMTTFGSKPPQHATMPLAD
jgi:hypothetical protein